MNILFVHPNPDLSKTGGDKRGFFHKVIGKMNVLCPPLTFPMLSAVTPRKHKVEMVDECHQKIDFEKNYDLVGITAMTHEIIRAYEIADEFRKRGAKVVIGGPHASALPEEAKQHADSVVIGEAEGIWFKLLEDLENGRLKSFYFQKKPPELTGLPAPDRNILNRLILVNGVQSSRGCPYRCKYCFVGNSTHGRVFRKRPVEYVTGEIKRVRQKLINFYDTSMTIDTEYTKTLCKALKEEVNKKFIFLGNINTLCKDDELLKLSREAGCIQWNIGFESISQESLREVNKNTNKVKEYYKAVKKIHDHGMFVHGFFMFGFDHDKRTIFEDTLEFIRKAEIDSADFSILTPFPGTPLYDKLLKEGRILTKDWSRYTYQNIVFEPKNFTKEEILSEYKKLHRIFYSYHEIAKRFVKAIRRGILNFHPFLFMIDNVFTRFYILERIKS